MNLKNLLSYGWIVFIAFILGTISFGYLLIDYNPLKQTVSEIGEIGSLFYLPFQIFCISIALFLVLFSVGIIILAKKNNLSIVPGILILIYGFAELGIGIFASPHSLHNVFGLLMLVGYFSPLLFALLWKNKPNSSFKKYSLYFFLVILVGIFLNLSPAFAPTLYPLEYYGIMQRFLLFTFYSYCAFVSIGAIRTF